MKVVIPYVPVYLHPETRALGESVHARFVDVSASDTAYFDLMSELWSAGEPFIIVEHDCIPTEALLLDLWNCPHEWCGGTYETPGVGSVWFLGTMKFGAPLLRRVPDVMHRAAEQSPSRHWNTVDLSLYAALGSGPTDELEAAGFTGKPHVHGPAIRHLH